jgi:hypothetical protein
MVCISITVTEIFDADHFWTAAEAAAGQRCVSPKNTELEMSGVV